MLTVTNLQILLARAIGKEATKQLLGNVAVHPMLATEMSDICSRAVLAEALNLALLHDLLRRVPTAQAYVAGLAGVSRRLVFDHGALRTVDSAQMGTLPAGEESIARVLRPLGYEVAETYPLDRLGMTGRSYKHADYPEDIPQFFVSELHVDRFSEQFGRAAARVTASSIDPLGPDHLSKLATIADTGSIDLAAAVDLIPYLVRCFARQHDIPALADYEILLAESAEMAWITTEGNAFNHATDRVTDIEFVANTQHALGKPMKETIEVSTSGRVLQTAYLADAAERCFVDEHGQTLVREVPGSFFEFIQRDIHPATGRMDLSFDTSNAQGIFKMTAAKAA